MNESTLLFKSIRPITTKQLMKGKIRSLSIQQRGKESLSMQGYKMHIILNIINGKMYFHMLTMTLCTINSKINGTPKSKDVFLPVLELQSILAIPNLLAHNSITISYYGQVNSVRLKSSVALKWACKHLWENHLILLLIVPTTTNTGNDKNLCGSICNLKFITIWRKISIHSWDSYLLTLL